MGKQFIIPAVLTVFATACGSSTTTSGSTSTPASTASPPAGTATAVATGSSISHLCTIFPKADAERLTGIALQPGEDTRSDCTYDRADSADHIAVVTVTLDAGSTQPNQYDFNRSHPIGGETLTDVPGIGDKAYYSPGFKLIVAIKGTNLIHVSIVDSSIADPKPVEIQIAQLAFTNLG